ncbi:MAG: hypothetical protein Q7R96_05140 [Nanoarchaeota archaeon]|nr:hypothetical protein [Nanoarchaeota archaeon]
MEGSSYWVSRRGETLAIESLTPTSVAIKWRTCFGALHTSFIEGGLEIRTEGFFGNGKPALNGEKGTFVCDYQQAFDEMGPKLREQLPQEWLSILGDWLKKGPKYQPETLDH